MADYGVQIVLETQVATPLDLDLLLENAVDASNPDFLLPQPLILLNNCLELLLKRLYFPLLRLA